MAPRAPRLAPRLQSRAARAGPAPRAPRYTPPRPTAAPRLGEAARGDPPAMAEVCVLRALHTASPYVVASVLMLALARLASSCIQSHHPVSPALQFHHIATTPT
jgi:hypothetical protein